MRTQSSPAAMEEPAARPSMSSLYQRRRTLDAHLQLRRPSLQLDLNLQCMRTRSNTDGSLLSSDQGAADGAAAFAALYSTGEVLGSGSTAVVRRARCLADGSEVAVKEIRSQDVELRQFVLDEYELATPLRHCGVVQMHGLYQSSQHVWICMELCPDGSAGSYIEKHGSFAVSEAPGLFTQMLRALDYLHGKRIVHRDLKPHNLLLCDEARTIKIADFNSAKQIGSQDCSAMLTNRGTRTYTAPELHFGNVWNERVDIWASGLCFYEMLCGKLPFDIQKRQVSIVLAEGDLPPIEWKSWLSQDHQNLILQCLAVNMFDRPPAMTLLQHAALTDVNCQSLSQSRCEGRAGVAVGSKHENHIPYTIMGYCSSSGILFLCATQQHLIIHEPVSCVNYWGERRDGTLYLQRLAEKHYQIFSPKKQLRPAHSSRQRSLAEVQGDEGQPEISRMGRERFFTRSCLVDRSPRREGLGRGAPAATSERREMK